MNPITDIKLTAATNSVDGTKYAQAIIFRKHVRPHSKYDFRIYWRVTPTSTRRLLRAQAKFLNLE